MIRIFAHLGTLALLAGLGAGCPRPRPTTPPRLAVDASRLSGLWLGETRDQPVPGVHRVVRILCQLEAHPSTGRITGSLEYRGAISTAYRGPLRCNRRTRARWSRATTISHGKIQKHRVTWTLGDAKQDGDAGCTSRFPLAKQCTLRQRSEGELALRCGGARVALAPLELTGVWAWDEERPDAAGDTQIKRQRFHLVQRGTRLVGFADDVRVHISRDGQRYRCNGRMRYSRQVRHYLEGHLKGTAITLRVTKSVAMAGPCQGQLTIPTRLNGTWKPFEDRLELPLTQEGRKFRRLPGLRPAGAMTPAPR